MYKIGHNIYIVQSIELKTHNNIQHLKVLQVIRDVPE